VPTLPAAGLLLYRADPGGGLEVLLFPRGAATGTPSSGKFLEIPCWELPSTLPVPASRAGVPYEPRRREKPRLTAQRTMDRLLVAAHDSFAALTGFDPPGPFTPLGGVKTRGHRIVYVWACPCGPEAAPGGGGRFAALDEARAVVDPQQRRFVDQLGVLVGGVEAAGPS
jgi:predicted NUDIX family NTP pyrophosphohydrolase